MANTYLEMSELLTMSKHLWAYFCITKYKNGAFVFASLKRQTYRKAR